MMEMEKLMTLLVGILWQQVVEGKPIILMKTVVMAQGFPEFFLPEQIIQSGSVPLPGI